MNKEFENNKSTQINEESDLEKIRKEQQKIAEKFLGLKNEMKKEFENIKNNKLNTKQIKRKLKKMKKKK